MSDVTTAQEGTLPEGQSSPASQGETSTQPRTITLEEHQAALNRLSDKLADVGRKHKAEVESLTTQLTDHQTRVNALMSQIEELEDKGVTTPDAKEVIRLKRELGRARAKLLEDDDTWSALSDASVAFILPVSPRYRRTRVRRGADRRRGAADRRPGCLSGLR